MSFDREKFLRANASLREKTPFGEPFPKGVYLASLVDCELNNAKSSGREQVLFTWLVEPPDDLAGRKIYEHIGTSDEVAPGKDYSQAEILNMKLTQLGVKDMVNFVQDFNNSLKFLAGRTKARLKIEHNGDFQQVRIDKLLENAFANGPITAGISHQLPVEKVVEPPKDTRQVGTYAPPKEEPSYPAESKIIIKHPTGGELVATIKMFNPAINKLFVIFDNTQFGSGMYDVKDIVKTLGDQPQQTTAPTPQPTIQQPNQPPFETETVEEVIEEVVIQVGMNVKFTYQNVERSGTIQEMLPDKNAVKIKSVDPTDNKARLYTKDIGQVTPLS